MKSTSSKTHSDLTEKCLDLRRNILEISFQAGTGHIGCNLSIVEMMAVVFHKHLRPDPETWKRPIRDYFVLSKGHSALLYYLLLSEFGFFSREELASQWNRDGSTFCEHPHHGIPGVDVSSGSLGHGLSVGAGIAMGVQEAGKRVFVLLGDGECNEGSVWEAAAFASAQKLGSLVALVDANGLQGLAPTKEILGDAIGDRFAAFGWDVQEVKGHDCTALEKALKPRAKKKPLALIAHTIKGYGVPFMEQQLAWHYKSLSEAEYTEALQGLSKKGAKR